MRERRETGARKRQRPRCKRRYSRMKWLALVALIAFSTPTVADDGTSLPVGSVIGFIGNPESLGPSWCLCDGRSLAIEDNLDLFRRIGWLYGLGSESKKMTTFNLPDFRGEFL